MSVIPMPPRERIPLDPNGFPEGHRGAFEAVVVRFMDMVNELPESVYHLNRADAEWIAEQMFRDYLRLLPRVR